MKVAVQQKETTLQKFENALEGVVFRRFMSVAYGLGASIVIIGALFKITHIKGANEALFIGMVTEAIIFALSALQKPAHPDPDWTKVYPELEKSNGETSEVSHAKTGGQTNKLDEMLQDAKIDNELIDRLGSGLRNLSNATTRMNDLSKVSVANENFITNLNSATQTVGSLTKSYGKTAEALENERTASNEFSSRVKEASKAASELKHVYAETSTTLKEDIVASQHLSKSIRSASESANKLAESYFKSSESIVKNIDELQKSTDKNNNFNNELKKLSDNLSSLNMIYELQLKSSQKQSTASDKLHQSMGKFLADIEKSSNQTVKYQGEMNTLTKKMASLNSVYGNMLTAMNVK